MSAIKECGDGCGGFAAGVGRPTAPRWVRDENGVLRCETIHHMGRRLPDFDYSSPLYKPGGKLFETCANGNLLMLASASWPYQVNEKPMTRFDATAMNRLAQWIAGEGAAEIDYKGMRPDNIDEHARAAAKVNVTA